MDFLKERLKHWKPKMKMSENSKLCLGEITEALKKTSLKGIPRIISAKHWAHKILWGVAVLALFGVCTDMVRHIISNYREYRKVVDVEEKEIDVNDPNNTVPFPTVTVCNLNQFGSNLSVFSDNHVMLPREFNEKILQMTECENCTARLAGQMDKIKRLLYSNRGYYQYAGINTMKRISNQNLIVHCHALIRIGTSTILFPCHEFSTNYSYVLPDTGLCHSFDTVIRNTHQRILGYKFILYTDSVVENVNTEFDPHFYPSSGSGALLNIHDPYIVPRQTEATATVPTGMATRALIKASRTDRISVPYAKRECIDTSAQIVTFSGRHFNYDHRHCKGECHQEFIARRCNCTDLYLLENVEIEQPEHEYCASIKRIEPDLYQKMVCVEVHKQEALATCYEQCKESCKEINYQLSVSTARWPLPSQLRSFHENVIMKHHFLQASFEREFPTTDIVNMTKLERFYVDRYVDDNFAHLTVLFSDSHYTHFESKPKTNLWTLAAELGGTLNLWSGITCIIVVELLDLLMTLLGLLFRRGSTKERGEKTESTQQEQCTSNVDLREIYSSSFGYEVGKSQFNLPAVQ